MKKALCTVFMFGLMSCATTQNKAGTTHASANVVKKARDIASVTEGELVLKGNQTSYHRCSMTYGNAVDSDVITLIQSKDVFFRIEPGNGDFYPNVIITNVDKKGMAHSHPVQFDVNDCNQVKSCIDQFANENLGIAASCDSEGRLRVDFYKR